MGSSSGVFLSDPTAKTLTLLHSSSFRLRIYFLYCVQARSSGKDLFYLTTYSTHFNMVFIIIFICHLTPDLYDVVNCKGLIHQEKVKHTVEREREMFYLTTHSTHFIYGYIIYGVRHMVKDYSDSEKGNLLPPHRLLLSINSKGSFICTIPQTG